MSVTGHSSQIAVDAAAAYELVISLGVWSDAAGAATYEAGPAWFDAVRGRASAELLAEVEKFCGGSDLTWAHLLSLAYECPPPRDVATFLTYLEQVDPMEVRLRLLGYYVRYFRRATPPETMLAAAAGDRAAQREFLRTSYPADVAWQAAMQALLPLTPQETLHRLHDILRRWYEQVFRPQEPQILPILERDAEEKRSLLLALAPGQVIEAAAPGIDLVPEPGIRRVLLIPSYLLRPQVHLFEHHETKIVAYPVSDESLAAGSDAPSPRLVRLARALGDERRLRVLKRLTGGSFTLQELADHFEVGNTTMLHHLTVLRQAGLVRVRSAAPKSYSLRRETLVAFTDLLNGYLEETPGSEH